MKALVLESLSSFDLQVLLVRFSSCFQRSLEQKTIATVSYKYQIDLEKIIFRRSSVVNLPTVGHSCIFFSSF